MKNRPIYNLVSIQFKEFYREPEIIFWAFLFPIALSWILGVAIGSGSKMTRTVAVIARQEAPSQAEADSLLSSVGRDAGIAFEPMTREQGITAIKKGEVSLLVERRSGGGLRYYFDPRSGDARMTFMIIDRALAIGTDTAGVGGQAGITGAKDASLRSETVELEVPGTRYIDFLVPGLLAMNIMSSAMWGVGWSLVEIRMKKLLRRMAATPMSKPVFLGSYFITRLIINAIEFAALFTFVHLYFGVTVQGSIPALIAVYISGNLAFSGVAVLTASRTANSRVANGLINAVTFPMMLLSGIFFSYHNFPSWAVPIIQKLPLTMLADSLRSIFTEGAGFAQTGLAALGLALMGTAFMYIGTRIFRWY